MIWMTEDGVFLVYQAAITKHLRHKCISHSSGGQKYKIKVPGDLVSGKGLLQRRHHISMCRGKGKQFPSVIRH